MPVVGKNLFRCAVLTLWSGAMAGAPQAAEEAAQDFQCLSVDVVVSADDATLSERICSAAKRAASEFKACGLRQSETVRIEVIDGLIPDHPSCAGIFHCGEARIELVAPFYVERALGTDHPFTEIPRDLFYDSLVAHELAHALAYQTRGGPLSSVAATEYLAYVMQMNFLPETYREAFLADNPVSEPVTEMALNEVVLAFSPATFAVRAWKHFNSPANGCHFIERLLSGDEVLSFPLLP